MLLISVLTFSLVLSFGVLAIKLMGCAEVVKKKFFDVQKDEKCGGEDIQEHHLPPYKTQYECQGKSSPTIQDSI